MTIGQWTLGALLAATVACGGVAPDVDRDASWTLDRAAPDGVLLGVWGSGPHDVWAVGGQVDRSLLLHSDGTRWSAIDATFPSLLYSVYGFSDSDIYAVGERGLILHYDGTSWVRWESGTELTLFGLWGASGDDVWIVGGDPSGAAGAAVVLRGTRGSFAPVRLPTELAPSALFKVHGFAADDVMVVGSDSTVLRWTPIGWDRERVVTQGLEPLFSTWGRDVDDVYAVGGTGVGEILHFDGLLWDHTELPIGSGLSGVFTSADGPTIAVGADALVVELGRDGSAIQATLPALDPAPLLHGVWGDGLGTTYAVGGDLDAYPGAMNGVILSRR